MDLVAHHPHCGSTTVNLGVVELGPSGGTAKLNLRFPCGLDAKRVAEKVHATAAAAQTTAGLQISSAIEGWTQEPLLVSEEAHPEFLSALQEAYQTVTGREPHLRAIAGTTYAKAFPLAVAFGPLDEVAGERELAHEVNERVTIRRHLENIRIYAMALAILACGA
ncbi:MAG: hypothetical protein GF330_05135 [Candidatus Eisenbacteria bacterium]|nr:hypothetical protein [Candidatus Eisenbacteria bacterium]